MIVRRVKIDFQAIAKATGITNGTICRMGDVIGWVVRNNSVIGGGYSCVSIDPPHLCAGETRVTIEDNHWCFHND